MKRVLMAFCILISASSSFAANYTYKDQRGRDCSISSSGSSIEVSFDNHNKAADLANKMGAMIAYMAVDTKQINVDNTWSQVKGTNGLVLTSQDETTRIIQGSNGSILSVEFRAVDVSQGKVSAILNWVGIPTSAMPVTTYRILQSCVAELN